MDKHVNIKSSFFWKVVHFLNGKYARKARVNPTNTNLTGENDVYRAIIFGVDFRAGFMC